ncbi:MAG: GAF domain-containing protein [Acholeplasmatales bacterium]|nr:GAF domain-containing protein [Acholeplasmatales bacterium]
MNRDYEMILNTLPSLLDGIDYDVTLLSNASALFNDYMDEINWVGFYLFKDGVLKLGPFQGHVACMVIPLNRGVCGACATKKETILVSDVHKFKGHIACDNASNSEICVPIFVHNEFYGLLDIDSPNKNSFNEVDKKNLEAAIHILEGFLEKI